MPIFYDERGQTRAKHDLLRAYLQPFAFKILRGYRSLDFIDGFAGPWENSDGERYSDTSFGITIETLADVQRRLAEEGLGHSIRCIFNEANRTAYERLRRYVEDVRRTYPGLEVHALYGEFAANAAQMDNLAKNGFRLVYVDPTGWTGYPRAALKHLISARNSEVMINFMSSFVDRFFRDPEDRRAMGLNEMLGADRAAGLASSATREEDVRREVASMLREEFGLRYVCESPIAKTDADQIHFWMLYGTRSPKGVEVLRDSEVKALSQHEKRRDDIRLGGQSMLFELPVPGPYSNLRRAHLENLDQAVEDRLPPSQKGQLFEQFAATIMAEMYVRKTEVKDSIVRCSAAGLVERTWKTRNPRAPKPDDRDLIRRPSLT